MTTKDATTISFYAREAVNYTSRDQAPEIEHLNDFLSRLPEGASILELGCGAGQDSQYMLDRGFDVTPTDGTPEIAEEAARLLQRPVPVLLFEDIAAQQFYDGIWANACLLHVPRPALPSIIGKIHAALKPSGVFYASFKAGNGEGRDKFDRLYNYPSAQWLREIYEQYNWQQIIIKNMTGSGYDKVPTEWLHVTAFK